VDPVQILINMKMHHLRKAQEFDEAARILLLSREEPAPTTPEPQPELTTVDGPNDTPESRDT
jgi:hypothetical protein